MAGRRRGRELAREPLAIVLSIMGLSVLAALPATQPVSSRVPDAVAYRAVPTLVAQDTASLSDPSPESEAVAPIVASLGRVATPTRPPIEVPQPEPDVVLAPAPGSTAVFLGDSFTSGWNGAGLGARGWPRLVGAAREWRTVNLAVAGTGFLNPGWTNQPIAELVSKAVRSDPDVIFIAGGHNDSRWSAAAIAQAADQVIDSLQAAAPDALLVVVAPIWQDGSPPARCLALRDHLQEKALAVGAVFIDPLAEGWFSGSSHRLISADGLHPTNAGHRFIAERVLAGLERG